MLSRCANAEFANQLDFIFGNAKNCFPRLLWINLWKNPYFFLWRTVFLRKITLCLKNRHKIKTQLIQIVKIFQGQKDVPLA